VHPLFSLPLVGKLRNFSVFHTSRWLTFIVIGRCGTIFPRRPPPLRCFPKQPVKPEEHQAKRYATKWTTLCWDGAPRPRHLGGGGCVLCPLKKMKIKSSLHICTIDFNLALSVLIYVYFVNHFLSVQHQYILMSIDEFLFLPLAVFKENRCFRDPMDEFVTPT